MTKYIFVFGSNLAGRHGAGSAKEAVKNHGAKMGIGVGLQGHSYAIPTKDQHLKTLDLKTIALHVDEFVRFAKQNPDMEFNVVDIGCGLAGYYAWDIAPMFRDAPENVILSQRFNEYKNADSKIVDAIKQYIGAFDA